VQKREFFKSEKPVLRYKICFDDDERRVIIGVPFLELFFDAKMNRAVSIGQARMLFEGAMNNGNLNFVLKVKRIALGTIGRGKSKKKVVLFPSH
jgi:hypothetical protein